MFGDYFRNKKVFITGHTGFKGAWLSLWLKECGAEIYGYALTPNTPDDLYVTGRIDQLVQSTIADIRDFKTLNKTIHGIQPEIIFHLAAQPLVRLSYASPRETYDINVMGTVNLLDSCRTLPSLQTVIIITSDKCYENKETLDGYCETDPMGGFDPYSSSKGCVELVVQSYQRSFFSYADAPLIASVRAGNVIGGGDWNQDRIVPDCIRALQAKMPIQVRSPKAVRPWQYVLEPLSGYLMLASKRAEADYQKYIGGWNFGPNAESIVPVSQVVDAIIDRWGSGTWEDVSNPTAVHEAKLLNLNCSKAKNQLQWQPMLNLNESVSYTVAWYKQYANEAESLRSYSQEQIKLYQDVLRKRGSSCLP